MRKAQSGGHLFCDGITRRGFLRIGAAGLGGLALSDLLRMQAIAASTARENGSPTPRPKSLILICLEGGPSHIDMYDMKPEAPVDYRGEFKPIATSVPGLDICEHFPLQARIADRFSIVRSLRMQQPDHQLHEVYTGFPTNLQRPSLGSVVSRVRGTGTNNLPPYVSLSLSDHPRTVALAEQPTYLGLAHGPFEPGADALENLQLNEQISSARLQDRKSLLNAFDRFRRDVDTRGVLNGMDSFTMQAMEILTSPRVRDAFDISREPQSIRDLYGGDLKSDYNYQFGHTWYGTEFLQARRLVEAGVPVVTLAPMAWDDHGNLNGVRGSIFERLGEKLPRLDRSLSALLTDLDQRGLSDDVLVVMWGEFGRTPRVNRAAGRDHWPPANFALFAGGGLKMGQVIGATDAQGAQVVGPGYNAQNVLATIYRVLGIDAAQTFPNFSGRPIHLLDDREPIRELV